MTKPTRPPKPPPEVVSAAEGHRQIVRRRKQAAHRGLGVSEGGDRLDEERAPVVAIAQIADAASRPDAGARIRQPRHRNIEVGAQHIRLQQAVGEEAVAHIGQRAAHSAARIAELRRAQQIAGLLIEVHIRLQISAHHAGDQIIALMEDPGLGDIGAAQHAEHVLAIAQIIAQRATAAAPAGDAVRAVGPAADGLHPCADAAVDGAGGRGSEDGLVLAHHHFVAQLDLAVLAYRSVKWSKPIPVEWFEGSVEEARLKALELNIKDKLPMSLEDKFEAAWSLVKEGKEKFSKSKIAKMTTVGERTVATMRSLLRNDPEAQNLSWSEAKRRQFTKDGDFDHDAWIDEKANKLAKQLLKVVTPKLIRNPEVLAESLRRIDASLPSRLVEEWSNEVRELVQQWEENEREGDF